MAATYTSGQLARLLQCSREYVRKLSIEYQDLLSDSASPEEGEVRRYDDSDIKKLAFIIQSRRLGIDNEDIIEGVKSGSRAEPEGSLSEIQPASQNRLADLQREILDLKTQLKQADDARLESDRERQKLAGQVELLKSQLDAANERMEELLEQALTAKIQLETERKKHNTVGSDSSE